jgi:hypothetical protein
MEFNFSKLKMVRRVFLIISFLPIALWSCEKSQLHDDPVTFEFQLLDESGKQSTKFSFEENFTFSFSIKNNTDEDLAITEMYSMDNFFEVFKIGDSDELISFGKPYDAIFCEYIGAYRIDSGDTLLVEIPWIPDQDSHTFILCGLKYDNTHLPVGNYQTSVSPTFTFQKGGEDFLTTTSSINISFQTNSKELILPSSF